MENEEHLQEEIYGKMAKLCSRTEQCTPEIRKKIKELGGDSLAAEKIIARLEEEKFLSDKRFVSLYVSEKFRVYKWGRIKMHYYLKMKGLKEEIIHAGFEEIDEDTYVQLLIKTMKEKARDVTNENKYQKMGQVIRFAQGRGFEPELIHRHLNQVMA
jgi:regulatory protein